MLMLVCIQGLDTIWRLVEDGSPGNWKIAGSIDQPKGSGPRHITVHGMSSFTRRDYPLNIYIQPR